MQFYVMFYSNQHNGHDTLQFTLSAHRRIRMGHSRFRIVCKNPPVPRRDSVTNHKFGADVRCRVSAVSSVVLLRGYAGRI